MPTVYKDGDRYRVQVRRQGVSPVSKTFKRHASAKQFARKIEVEIDEGEYVAPIKLTVEELFLRYRRDVTSVKDDWKWEHNAITRLMRSDWTRRKLTDCTDSLVDWCEERKAEVSADTVNRELNVISGIFTYAIKRWRIKLRANPVKSCLRPPKGKHRRRRPTDQELSQLWTHFGVSPPTKLREYVPWMFEFACQTGLRMGELMRLRWRDVDLGQGTIYVLHSKNGDDRHALLTDRAEELLRGLPRLDDRVFPVNAGSIGVEFREACKELGIQDLHFHDSRHEATSQLAKKLSVQELAAVIGHRDLKSLLVYYNPTPAELAAKLRGGARSSPARPTQPTSACGSAG